MPFSSQAKSNEFLIAPEHRAVFYFPASFAVECGHVTEFQPTEYEGTD